jgi:regulator of nucleoside diphosphate kinase
MANDNIVLNKMDHIRINKCILEAINDRSINRGEIERLQFELGRAKIVEPHEVPDNVVTMNSIVKLSFLNSNKQVQFQIVYPDQASIKRNKISIFSPIATALIGYKVGDEIEWIVPAGLTHLKIDEIIYQPEASGHYNL